MRTWFIWNDHSTEEYNITLEEEPDIVKPAKRYNTTLVDYVDGCITENLGYSAYQIEIKIGFKWDDVSNVKEWLNGSSKLILYTEPEMYYQAQILEEIKYEKEFMFCHATVKFLVQPYKYAISEDCVEISGKSYVYNSGNCKSLPTISVTGSGTTEIDVNGESICTIALGETARTLVLDSEKQDCYCEGALSNRAMAGEFPTFEVGENTIELIGGTISKVLLEVKTRWI